MTRAREEIFAALEAARPPAASTPTRVSAPAMPEDPEAVLSARLAQSGGRLQSAHQHDWVSQIEWPLPLADIEHLYIGPGLDTATERLGPSALASRGIGVADRYRSGRELEGLEVCVLPGAFAVVENGACWQRPTSPFERAAALLAEHLILVVDSTALVPTLHQAYERIDLAATTFGWFLCGPSKTADIEQALVLGAHGPRSMSLVLLHP